MLIWKLRLNRFWRLRPRSGQDVGHFFLHQGEIVARLSPVGSRLQASDVPPFFASLPSLSDDSRIHDQLGGENSGLTQR